MYRDLLHRSRDCKTFGIGKVPIVNTVLYKSVWRLTNTQQRFNTCWVSFGRFVIAYCNTLLICTAPTSEWKRWRWDRWWPPLNKTQTDKDVKCTICTTGRRYFVLSTLYLVRWQWLTQGREENGFSSGNRFQFALPPPSVIEVTRWCLRLRLLRNCQVRHSSTLPQTLSSSTSH